jgi:RNA polymerase sigma factor (sigma-70 family)
LPLTPATGARLGVVDDDPVFRRTLVGCLQGAGYQVDEYEAATDYLRRRPTAPHDVLVLDVDMPGLSGLELQAALGSGAAAPPVVFVSGTADIPQSVRAMHQGAVDFLVKPFQQEQLLEAVRRALSRGSRERAEALELRALEEALARLTERERMVCELVAQGLLNKQVAGSLGTTENTVKVHRTRAMEKLGVSSLPDLVRLLERIRLLRAAPDGR